MAAALAQDGLDAAAEFLELLIRDEGLNGARKAAAVHAACAVAAQQVLGQCQRERDLLTGRAALGDHILQIHPRRIAGFLDVLKEGGKNGVLLDPEPAPSVEKYYVYPKREFKLDENGKLKG